MEGISNLISVMAFGAGIYVLYAYHQMNETGKINANILLSKGMTEDQCKNKEEFIGKAKPVVLLFGIAAMFYGLCDVLLAFVFPGNVLLEIVNLFAIVLFFGVLVFFVIYTARLRKRYFY